MVNYAEEAKCLSNGFWKVPVGETVIQAVGEMSAKMELSYDGDNGPEVREKVDLEVEVGGERHVWRLSVHHSEKSLFGQLILIAAERGGLQGRTLKVQRDGNGRGTSYAVEHVGV